MVAITSTISLTFVREELDSLLGQAERHLEAWSADASQVEALAECVSIFTQMRGVFELLQLPAATLMSEEMLSYSQWLSTAQGASGGSGTLGQSVLLLGRYLEYVQLKNQPLPELLISGINELRRAAGKPLIQESHFFSVDLGRSRQPKPAMPDTPRSELPRLCRRLRHMYQVGLIGVLRDDNSAVSLKLMARALARVDKLCGPLPISSLWWVSRAALEAMSIDMMVLTPARKALLGQIDRQLKRLIYEGEDALKAKVPLMQLKEAIYVVSLSAGSSATIAEVKQSYDLRSSATDAYLQSELMLMGGGGAVLRTVAANIKDELSSLKQSLDMASQDVADTNYLDVAEALAKLSSTLAIVGFPKEAQLAKAQVSEVRSWQKQQVDLEGGAFHRLVDDLLTIENTIAAVELRPSANDDVRKPSSNKSISLYQLDDARVTVVGECRAALALTKREVASFVESNWDQMHLANLPKNLAAASGGLTFLELYRAKAIVNACAHYIEQGLLASESKLPTHEQMDTFADAITAVDYYLESIEEHKPIGIAVLEVAEESMHELGHPVARAVSA